MPDSAGTSTAYLCGVKTNFQIIGVNAAARYNNCSSQKGNEVLSVMYQAKKAGGPEASLGDRSEPEGLGHPLSLCLLQGSLWG